MEGGPCPDDFADAGGGSGGGGGSAGTDDDIPF
jgi:hypothetical protein